MGERRAFAGATRHAQPARAELVDVLFRRHYAALVRLAVVMLGSREAAEDAVQDAFVALHRNVAVACATRRPPRRTSGPRCSTAAGPGYGARSPSGPRGR